MSKRENYVDIGKGLAIIAIVCVHISQSFMPGAVFGFWPIAFFFVVAGFYLGEDKLLKPVSFVKHRLKTLYLPGTVIYLLAVLLHNPFCKWGFYPLGEVHPSTQQPFALWDCKTYLLNILKTVVAPNGELAMGAMWFLYALFFSLCFISIFAYCTNLICKRRPAYANWFYAFVFVISSVALVLAHYGIKVPRISNALVIMPFILCGYLLKQKVKVEFNNWALFFLFLVIYVQCMILPHSSLSFTRPEFPNIALPLIMGVSIVYVVLFISRHLEKTRFLSGMLSYIGRDSLYIMALHVCGFFLCTKVIDLLGLNAHLAMAPTLNTYSVGGNIGLFLLYLFFGISFPLLCIYLYRVASRKIVNAVKTKGY